MRNTVLKLASEYQKKHPYTENELTEMILYCQNGEDEDQKNEYMTVIYWYYISDIYCAVSGVHLPPQSCIDEEDIMGEAVVSLLDAVRTYRRNKGATFRTYVSRVSSRRARRYAMQCGRRIQLPEDFSKKLYAYKEFCNKFQMEYGRIPSRKEIQESLHYKDADMDRLEIQSGIRYATDICEDTGMDDRADVIDENSAFEEEAEADIIRQELQKAVREEIRQVLDPEEQKILCYRNGIGCECHSIKETADRFGKSEQEILGDELIIREKLKASHGMQHLAKTML